MRREIEKKSFNFVGPCGRIDSDLRLLTTLDGLHHFKGSLVVVVVDRVDRGVEAVVELALSLALIGDEDGYGRHLEDEDDADEQAVGGQEALLLSDRAVQSDEADEHARESRDDQKDRGAVEAARVDCLADLKRAPQSREVLVVL